MPRRRPDPFEIRARQLNEEARDRRYREQVLAQQAAQATPEPDLPPEPSQEAPEDPTGFDETAWRANTIVVSLMRSRYGANWASNRSLHRTAERALQDLRGAGDGKALRYLRTNATNGTYSECLDFKFGPIPTPIY